MVNKINIRLLSGKAAGMEKEANANELEYKTNSQINKYLAKNNEMASSIYKCTNQILFDRLISDQELKAGGWQQGVAQ